MGLFDNSEEQLFNDKDENFFNNEKISIVIVADIPHQKYGSFLLQLLSQNDDTDGNIKGVKDGTVEVSVCNDLEYMSEKRMAHSTEKYIFIGDSIIIRNETANISRSYKKYGMQYGWLGSRAILDLDQHYTGFVSHNTRNDFGKYVVKMHNSVGLTDNGRDSWKTNARLAANPFVVKDVQYNCLIEAFYIQAVQKFVENSSI